MLACALTILSGALMLVATLSSSPLSTEREKLKTIRIYIDGFNKSKSGAV